jgi:DNA-binding response OmpR family regulator
MGEMRGSRPAATRRPTVLVAEDDSDVAILIGESLHEMGCVAHVALDGESALRILYREKPALLLVDLGLPRLDGIAVTRLARAHFSTALPIIAMTGWGDPGVHARARAAGCDLILRKPFTIEALREAVDLVLARTLPS